MNKRFPVLLAGLCLVVLLAGAYMLYNELSDRVELPQLSTQPTQTSPSGQKTEPEVSPVPDGTFYDMEGNTVKLSDFRGKPVVLNFWASWCGPCKSEMPDFDSAYAEYADRVHFLMVNVTDGYRETQSTASEFIAQSGYGFPVYLDKDAATSAYYGVNSLPTTFFIDADGYLVTYATGALNMENLQKGLRMILGQTE